ncbi:MAG: hypothetical protein JWO37_1086 [Acidimicrobiales bacterium]|nr:hypothetical protein [Acidimicrobiales bacterium]
MTILALAVGALASSHALAAAPPVVDPTVPAARETEPVVLTGASFPQWAAPAEVTAKAPSVSGASCTSGDNGCGHNSYQSPEVASGKALGEGVPIGQLLGYRWDGHGFVQIPFQVDEFATRYLSNDASTFSFYSETDQNLTPVFDEERFRWTGQDPANPCRAVPADPKVRTTADPVPGLDTNDEVAFMASDAGPPAPAGAALPAHVVGAYRVDLRDPTNPNGPAKAAYVMRSDGTVAPAYTAANGYVRYQPDADSDTYLYSQSAYGSYGNAAKGAWLDPTTGQCVTNQPKQRRPKDTAWVRTPRYQFRYDGRWLMTQVGVAPSATTNDAAGPASSWVYGPDLVDQWKARAFQQRPGGVTPCCGYEEEANNWGGSSILMGVRAGPVRMIRATWGADSSTNNVRTEYFYRDEIRMDDALRVHVIPPGDGIYTQWDFNAGAVSTYSNAFVPDGVPADGQNDEVFGNTRAHVGPDGLRLRDGDQVPVVGPQDVSAGSPADGSCSTPAGRCIDNDIDVVDPTFSGPLGTLSYEEVSGPYGTWVDRWTVKQVTGGTAYGLATTPYYRDDSCFDDGTGSNPGPHVRSRAPDPTVDATGAPRACWKTTDGDPTTAVPFDHFFQGAIATHGLHVNLIADSDNAFTTAPVDEVDSEQRIVLLPGRLGNVGERYGRGTEKPLIATTQLL